MVNPCGVTAAAIDVEMEGHGVAAAGEAGACGSPVVNAATASSPRLVGSAGRAQSGTNLSETQVNSGQLTPL
jgi:hypothetical protein